MAKEFATTRKTRATGGRIYAKASFTAHTLLFFGYGRGVGNKKARAVHVIFSARAIFFTPKFCGHAALPTAARVIRVRELAGRSPPLYRHATAKYDVIVKIPENDEVCDVHLQHQNVITIF